MLNTHRLSLRSSRFFGSLGRPMKLLEKINHSLKGALAAAIALTSLSVMAQEDKLKDGLYAEIDTTKGTIVAQLEFEKTPLTVANFVGLAEGTRHYSKTEGKPVDQKGKPYYNGILFHRVIKDFMIQTGCPQGTGRGGPGYRFPDEFDKSLRHTGAGILSMANSGPGTNGSQFFITHKATPWLDDRHSVFGKVIKGSEVVDAIAGVQVVGADRPVEDVSIKTVKIKRVGEKAKAFKGDEAQFAKLSASIKSPDEKNKAEGEAFLAKVKKAEGVKTTASGLAYKVLTEGTGPNPKATDQVTVHYTGKLINGEVFDSSVSRGSPFEFTLGAGMLSNSA